MQLDSRTWLLWGTAASFPVLVSRNPFLLAELLVIVLVIRALSPSVRDWAWMLRIVSILVLISVIFNLLTVHSGDRVIGTLPDAWPIIGGALTWNALIYGVASGMAIFLMVLTWTLVAANLRWSALMRQLPPRLTPIAVAGSVAWSYLPRMHETLRDIRESQRSRGWQPGHLRDLPAIIVPLLAGGLERSLITAEVLEVRGLGGPPPTRGRGTLAASLRLLGGIVAIVTAMYCLLAGQEMIGLICLALGVTLLTIELRRKPHTVLPTRLRDDPWSRWDSLCVVASGASILIVLIRLVSEGERLAFNPYPLLQVPIADPVAMAALFLLFVPAIAPVATPS